MRYTLEPVHEGYELLSDKPLGTLEPTPRADDGQ
jgi:hypothetical protein